MSIPKRITERVTKRLEAEILRQRATQDAIVPGSNHLGMMYLDVVARYIPLFVDSNGEDKWAERPKRQPFENERTYSDMRLYHMVLVLAK